MPIVVEFYAHNTFKGLLLLCIILFLLIRFFFFYSFEFPFDTLRGFTIAFAISTSTLIFISTTINPFRMNANTFAKSHVGESSTFQMRELFKWGASGLCSTLFVLYSINISLKSVNTQIERRAHEHKSTRPLNRWHIFLPHLWSHSIDILWKIKISKCNGNNSEEGTRRRKKRNSGSVDSNGDGWKKERLHQTFLLQFEWLYRNDVCSTVCIHCHSIRMVFFCVGKYSHFFYVTGLIEMMALAHFRDCTISKHTKNVLLTSNALTLR